MSSTVGRAESPSSFLTCGFRALSGSTVGQPLGVHCRRPVSGRFRAVSGSTYRQPLGVQRRRPVSPLRIPRRSTGLRVVNRRACSIAVQLCQSSGVRIVAVQSPVDSAPFGRSSFVGLWACSIAVRFPGDFGAVSGFTCRRWLSVYKGCRWRNSIGVELSGYSTCFYFA